MKFKFLAPLLSPFLRQKTSSDPVSGEPIAPVPPTETVSTILQNIIGASGTPEPVAKPPKINSMPSADSLNVGSRLDNTRRRAVEMAERLVVLADTGTARVISSLQDELRRQTCCIAFAGQVKSGKSSLINVLVERLDFLPSDINPCTAVITRLNFGVPDKPQTGALFTFFSREEWRRLSSGGRTRELTDRLFPDFDWTVFKAQVKTMEERAKAKHGAELETLLGKAHFYEKIQPGALIRYVGAEHPDAHSAEERAEGEFSDITKCADIFLDRGAFSFPAIVIDTPGVNDPFLVRDEITRQNLNAADICVIVVTARQPLSTADLNLLRMLRGLKKDRLIVFVNKIDELQGGDDILGELKQRVSATLEREFPSAHIPVILGSAALAHKSVTRNTPAAHSSGETAPLPQSWSMDGFQWPDEDAVADQLEAENCFEKSGLLPLAATVSDLMGRGPAAGVIDDAARLIERVSRNLIAWQEIKAGLLRQIPALPALAEMELGALTGVRAELAAKLDSFPAKLAAVHARKVSHIIDELTSAAEAFIPAALAAPPDGDISVQASQIDVKLRMRLETVFLDTIESVRGSLANEQEILRSELSSILEARNLTGNPEIVFGKPLAFAPSLAALSEPAALGFAAHLTKLAGTPASDQDRKVDLSALMMADFAPIIEKLSMEAARVFDEAGAAFASQAADMILGPIDMVIKDASMALEKERTQPSGDAGAGIRVVQDTISGLKFILEAQ